MENCATYLSRLLLGLFVVGTVTLRAQTGTAVVVGISDYKDGAITDLRFAHRDAEAFADYLRGAGVDTKLLTNKLATRAAIESALAWQRERAAEGELAILYFAGHGDAETADDIAVAGYLLAHDTPPNNYPLTAIGLAALNHHLSAITGAGGKALVVTDACHSGSLAGSAINGAQLTAKELMREGENQVRILSCLPEELAIEGEEWGGGRGVFSYFFVDALKGLADEDQNKIVDLFEMSSFIRSKVREATQRKQLPMLSGDQGADINFRIEKDATGAIRETRTRNLQQEFIDGFLGLATSASQKDYTRFERAIGRGELLAPEDRSALRYYKALRQDPALAPIGSVLAERLTVSLLDSVQQALVAYLATDREELYLRARGDDRYGRFVAYLEVAGGLLGEADPRRPGIRLLEHYFEAVRLRSKGDLDDEHSKKWYREGEQSVAAALAIDSSAAYVWNELGLLRLRRGEASLAQAAFRRAIERSPTWALPYSNLGAALRAADAKGNYAEARQAYETAIRLKPGYSLAYNNLGNLLAANDEPTDTVVAYLKRALAIDPRYVDARYSLATLYSNQDAHTEEALSILDDLIDGNDRIAKYHFLRGFVHLHRKEYQQAAAPLQRAVTLSPEWEGPYLNLINLYSRPGADKASAKDFYRSCIAENPGNMLPYAALALADTTDFEWVELAAESPLPAAEKAKAMTAVGYRLAEYGLLPLTERAFLRATEVDVTATPSWAGLATLYLVTGEEKKALSAGKMLLESATPAEVDAYCSEFAAGGSFESLGGNRRIRSLIEKKCGD